MDRKNIGRYEVLEEIGRGGMGSVLRAHDPAVGRVVAIKSIHAASLVGEQADEYRQRFYREARAAGALSHPGIVPVFDVGEQDGSPYLVMELVQGCTLETVLKRDERYSLDRVCQIGQQIAEALGFAHRHGVIHRDIKPANILMTSREAYGTERPRITDFGVAKLVGGEMTSTGQLLGTPAFMAPEQFTGAHIDGRADLFSLGVVLYRMTTGELPFAGETITAVSYKIVHTEPIPPSMLNPSVPPEMEAVILKSLAKNSSLRYQTGEELAAELDAVRTQVLGANPATVFPVSAPAMNSGAGRTVGQIAGLQPGAAAMPSAPSATATQILGQAAPSAPVMQSLPAATPPPVAMQSAALPLSAAAPAPPMAPVAQAPPPRPAGSAALMSRGMKRGVMVLALVAAAVVAVFATRFFLGNRVLQAPQQTSTPQAAEATPAVPQPEAETITQPVAPPAASAPAAQAAVPPPSSPEKQRLNAKTNQPPVAAKTPALAAAAANVVPQPLDPEKSARIRITLDGFSAFLNLALEVDGKVYWSGSAGDPQLDNGLLVPPGKHDLCVLVKAQSMSKTSNTLSGDFAAKKRVTISAKLRPQTVGGSSTVDPSAQVTIGLKGGFFSF